MKLDDQPLVSALLELDRELAGRIVLCIGGGLGLFLKQVQLLVDRPAPTLFALDQLPSPRTTEDIDVILRAEVVTDSAQMKLIREALDRLGYEVIESAKFMQFVKRLGAGVVKVDLLAGPLGSFGDRVPHDPRRIKPRPSVGLHARRMDEALAVDESRAQIQLEGQLPDGAHRSTMVAIPGAFPYLLMKLMAFRDRLHDEDHDLGRHHALDLYRIVGMLTREEYQAIEDLVRRYTDHAVLIEARRVIETHFAPEDGLGRIRIREHSLASAALDIDRFVGELRALLARR
jgi:hypothetical protein